MIDEDVEHGVSQKEDPDSSHKEDAGHAMMDEIKEDVEHPQRQWRKKMGQFAALKRKDDAKLQEREQKKRGPALAYQFGNTIIVEDEDGEVLKKYDIPQQPKRPGMSDRKTSVVGDGRTRERIQRMGTYMGLKIDRDGKEDEAGPSSSAPAGADRRKTVPFNDPDDDNIRFTVTAGGRRMSKAEFIQQIQRMDPKSRAEMVEDSDVPEAVKKEAREDAKEDAQQQQQQQQQQSTRRGRTANRIPKSVSEEASASAAASSAPLNLEGADAALKKVGSKEDAPAGPDGLALVDSNNEEVPFHSFSDDFSMRQSGAGAGGAGKETAAQRRRRLADPRDAAASPPAPSSGPALGTTTTTTEMNRPSSRLEEGETAAERRRREGALGLTQEENSDSEEDEGPTGAPSRRAEQKVDEVEAEGSASRPSSTPGIRFADQVRPPQQGGSGNGQAQGQGSRGLRWGADVGRKR